MYVDSKNSKGRTQTPYSLEFGGGIYKDYQKKLNIINYSIQKNNIHLMSVMFDYKLRLVKNVFIAEYAIENFCSMSSSISQSLGQYISSAS